MNNRERTAEKGFVGILLTPELLKQLDERVEEIKAETGSGNRSSVIRMAIIEFLK